MLRHIAGLIATVIGVLVALLVGLWALLCLAFVAIGAIIVHSFRSRDAKRGRRKDRRNVIEGEFSVVDEKGSEKKESNTGGHPGPPAPR